MSSPTLPEANDLDYTPTPPLGPVVHRSKTAPPPIAHLDLQTMSSPPDTTSPSDSTFPTFTSPEPTDVDHRSGASSSSTSPEKSAPSSALRRSSSQLSSGSITGSRDKKRLRFTPLPQAEAGPSGTLPDDEEVFFPGESLRDIEEGKKRRGKGIPKDQTYLASDPGTPNILETADQIRRTLSLASVDSLLLLQANQSGERERLIKEVSKVGKDLVWRSQDEKRLLPRDTERASVLALKRGLRSFLLAFSVRAGVNVLLMLFRTFRRHRLRLRVVLHAILGPEPFRFGAMIGTFTFLNTLTLNLLRLAPPLSYYRRRLKAGLFRPITFGPPQREGDEGERRWQAAVAGAIGSLGLLWEAKSRRAGVAQQMFVRGLQGAYNLYTPQYGIHIPHGDLLVFGACSGQIMFSFLFNPETMPKEYNTWIQAASRLPKFSALANRAVHREGILPLEYVQQAIDYPSVLPVNKTILLALMEKIKQGWKPHGAVPCEMIHPWSTSCTNTTFRRFFSVFQFMLPVYSALHLIPMLVLRSHAVRTHPLRMLARAIIGITRSCSFLGVFVVINQGFFCLRTNALGANLPEWLRVIITRKEAFRAIGFSTCLSLLVEEKKRRAELAMYVLPRALESAWSSARKKAWVPIVPFGETILGAAAMAMVMDAYKHQPQALSGIVRRLMFQLVGPV